MAKLAASFLTWGLSPVKQADSRPEVVAAVGFHFQGVTTPAWRLGFYENSSQYEKIDGRAFNASRMKSGMG
ncbi:MAG: hypothetical protein DPW18_02605 [Chloroflexi bacterium]|nr:hypothetical protein [Chloroflexota bacterium]MDL1942742.1 hypothetical protein [Chloroflexi bacterium CFX2]